MNILNYLDSIPLLIFLAGAAGSFFADVLKDNCIILPEKIGRTLNLGFFGGLLIGGMAGYYIDGSLETAFIGGFFGKEVITRILKIESIKLKTPTLKTAEKLQEAEAIK